MHQANDVKFSTAQLATGVTLQYAEKGDPTGEAIIFLHGYSDSWFSFSRVLPLLAPSYHAFALTQRGHGDSDKPQCCYTPEDFATDVDTFMNAVGIAEATVVGASTGALFAQRVALSYPNRVSRLVMIGAQTPANEDVMGLVEEMRALEDPVPPEFVTGFQESTIYQPVPQEFLDTVVSESLKLPARVWRDYLEQAVLSIDSDYVLALREIEAPTLMLWGEQDPLFPREEQERLAGTIPNATLKVYPETGHAVHWDRPEWVVRDLEEFMNDARVPPSTSAIETERLGEHQGSSPPPIDTFATRLSAQPLSRGRNPQHPRSRISPSLFTQPPRKGVPRSSRRAGAGGITSVVQRVGTR